MTYIKIHICEDKEIEKRIVMTWGSGRLGHDKLFFQSLSSLTAAATVIATAIPATTASATVTAIATASAKETATVTAAHRSLSPIGFEFSLYEVTIKGNKDRSQLQLLTM